MTIVFWSAGWLAGIWLAATYPLPLPLRLLIGTLALLSAVLWRRQTAVSFALVTITAAGFGATRYDLLRPAHDEGHIAFYNDTNELHITGWISRHPEIHDTYQMLTVAAEQIETTAGARAVQGLILVRAPRFPLQSYGTPVRLTGDLDKPASFSNEFDYQAYLAHQDIYSLMEFPQIELLEGSRGNPLLLALTAVRRRAQAAINQMLPGPQAALLSGILLGDDHGLPPALEDAFKATSMSHIIAISGFNIAIIAGLLLQGSRLLFNRRTAAWAALAGVVLYTLLVGAEASVVRAAIMGALFIIAAQLLGRPSFAPAGLCTAAFFMTLADPDILWNIGFQLSLAATLGLMLFVSPARAALERGLEERASPDQLRRTSGFISDILLTTLAAFAFTIPILLYHFGSISIISLPANLLILPVQSWLMLWGGVAVLLGMVHPLLGQLPAWIDWIFLTYTIEGVNLFARLSVTAVPFRLPAAGAWLLYAGLAGVAWLTWKRERIAHVSREALRNKRLPGLAFVFALLLCAATLTAYRQAYDGRLHVSFLDVGQGDAILIQAPNGRQMLVDGGAYPTVLLSELGHQLPFWDKHLDLILATHPDTDHVAGLVDVLDHYQVDQFIGSTLENNGSPAYRALLETAGQHQVPAHVALAGEQIELEENVVMEVLHAASTDKLSDNDNSIVLRLRYERFTLLLTGDSAAAAEEQLLDGGRPLQATVLKAAHHGSVSSTGELFLQAVRPQVAIISVGAENRFGHPHPDTLLRLQECGATVLRTDELGTIELISDGSQFWWR